MGGHVNRIDIRRIEVHEAHMLLDLRIRNRAFLTPYEPNFPDAHYTLEGQQNLLEKAKISWDNDAGYAMGIFLANTHQLIGRVSLSNVVRGAWESCTLGYFLDEPLNGQGLMTEALSHAVQFAFGTIALHRIQAAVMPWNVGSIRVLEKVGFEYEGYAKHYLKINGVWEDHNLYSITSERWPGGQ